METLTRLSLRTGESPTTTNGTPASASVSHTIIRVVRVVNGYESESARFNDLLHVFREHLYIVAMYIRVDE